MSDSELTLMRFFPQDFLFISMSRVVVSKTFCFPQSSEKYPSCKEHIVNIKYTGNWGAALIVERNEQIRVRQCSRQCPSGKKKPLNDTEVCPSHPSGEGTLSQAYLASKVSPSAHLFGPPLDCVFAIWPKTPCFLILSHLSCKLSIACLNLQIKSSFYH